VELYAEKVQQRGLSAVAQCESLRYKLLAGLAVRRHSLCSGFFLIQGLAMVYFDLLWSRVQRVVRSLSLANSAPLVPNP